jgi:DNA-binding NarL/FixJ family response regulator
MNWFEKLSARELEVCHALAGGITDREISEKLGISLYTVKTHLRNIYCKTEIKNRSKLIVEFLKNRNNGEV